MIPTIALTLIQPWGLLIMLTSSDRKDIENRTWEPYASVLRPGQRLWIHAGKKLDHDVVVWAREEGLSLERVPTGALLGHVRFDGIVRSSVSEWFNGPVGWMLSDPVPLPEPIPCRGAQGLWLLPGDVLARCS